MIGPVTRMYIYKKVRQEKKIPFREINHILAEYEDYVAANGFRLVFTLYIGVKIYEANSMPKKSILASPAWAIRLVTYNDGSTRNAFWATLGHELTHKDGFYHGKAGKEEREEKTKGTSDLMFRRWVLEAYCDFGAARRLGSRDLMLYAIEYKIELKKDQKDWPIHPSWKRRWEYIAWYDFDDELIDQIAIDVGCTNQGLIGRIKDYYFEKHILLE